MGPRWQHPFTCVVAGPTQSGKTEFVQRFSQHVEDMITPLPTKIMWSYGEWQPIYQSLLDKVHFVQGLPEIPLYSKEPLLLVIDDQMHGVDQRISTLFTKGSHHRNLSVIYIVQNLFDQHKEHRTISLNAHYLVIFKTQETDPRLYIWPSRCVQEKLIMFVKPLQWQLNNLMDTSWLIWSRPHQKESDWEVMFSQAKVKQCMWKIYKRSHLEWEVICKWDVKECTLEWRIV